MLDGHTGPIVGLAVAGRPLARLCVMDHSVRLWPLVPGATRRVFEGNQQNVNGVAFSPDDRDLVSAGYDATLRIWRRPDGGETVRILPTPLNTVAVAGDGEIVTAGADGKVYFLSPQGEMRADVQASATPVIAVAISPDGALVAAAGVRGSVAVIERKTRRIERTLVGPGLPVWSVVFFPTAARCSPAAPSYDPPLGRGERRPDRFGRGGRAVRSARGLRRRSRGAGVPRLRRLSHAQRRGRQQGRTHAARTFFGRRIATLSGYNFSMALKQLDIVWSPETVAKLFEVGPMAIYPRHQDAGAKNRLSRKSARRWWSFWEKRRKNNPRGQSGFLAVVELALLALAQIIVGGAKRPGAPGRRTDRIALPP